MLTALDRGWMHAAPKLCALRTPAQAGSATGGFQRSDPTGAWA